MIHYNVSFSYKDGVVESDELAKANQFLDGLMIEHVDTFIVEVFDELTPQALR